MAVGLGHHPRHDSGVEIFDMAKWFKLVLPKEPWG